MATLAQLIVEFGINASQFTAGIKDIQKESKEAEKSLKPLKDAALSLGAPLLAVGTAITGGLVAVTKVAADYGDTLNDVSQQTGATVQELSKLKFAAEQSGASFEDVSSGLSRLARNAAEAASGSKAQAEAFKALGVEVTDASGKIRPVNELLGDVADRFADMPNGVDKTAAAIDLFGKGGAALIPTLNAGRAGLAAMGDQAERLGVVIDQEAATAADEFNDKMAEITTALQGVAISLGGAVMPLLTDLAAALTTGIAYVSNFAREHETLTKIILGVGAALAGAGGILVSLGAIGAAIGPITTAVGLLGAAFTAVTGALSAAGIALTGLSGGPLAVAALALVALTYKIADATGLIDALAKKIGDWTGANERVTAANRDLEAATNRAAITLKDKYGVEIERGSKSLEQWNKEIVESLRNHASQTQAVKTAGTAQMSYTEQIKKTKEEQERAKKAAEDHKKAVEELKKAQDLAYSTAYKLSQDAVEQMEKESDASIAYHSKQLLEKYDADIKYNKDMVKAYELAQAAVNRAIDTGSDIYKQQLASNSSEYLKSLDAEQKAKDSQIQSIQKMEQANAEFIQKKHKEAYDAVYDSAGKIYDDIFVKGNNVFNSIGDFLSGWANTMGRTIFQNVTATLFSPLKEAFDSFFTGLLESTGITSFVNGLGAKIGGALNGVLGGSSVPSVSGGGIPGVGGGGSVSSGGGFGGGGFDFGGLIGGGIAAAGSLLGSMRLEGTMNAVEANTRFTYIEIRDMMNEILWPMHKLIWEIRDNTGYILDFNLKAFAGMGVTGFATGTDYVERTGLALLHRGEAVIPERENRRGRGGSYYFNVNVESGNPAAIEAAVDRMIPKITKKITRRVEKGSDRMIASGARRGR